MGAGSKGGRGLAPERQEVLESLSFLDGAREELFPIPLIPKVSQSKMSLSNSKRVLARHKEMDHLSEIANDSIRALNELYGVPGIGTSGVSNSCPSSSHENFRDVWDSVLQKSKCLRVITQPGHSKTHSIHGNCCFGVDHFHIIF